MRVTCAKASACEEDSDEDSGAGAEVRYVDEESGRSSSSVSHPCPHGWPSSYRPIARIRFESIEQAKGTVQEFARREEAFILENTELIDTKRWADISYIAGLLSTKKVLVKKSRDNHFRYFDPKKNAGKFDFEAPVMETHMTCNEFLAHSQKLIDDGMPDRLYLQETLSGHDELAKEFGMWKWDLVLTMSKECGWGIPDTNELFIGMQGVETPLHFDEQENLFYQVRGSKEVCLFPWTDYVRLYPFPCTHPCDRQSMVGNPKSPDLEAFPRFSDAVGYIAELSPGDLLYIPYGWWHWLRNTDHLAVSVSFWSKARPVDMSGGVPDKFTAGQYTRVRRNLESILAEDDPAKLNEEMLRLKQAIVNDDAGNPNPKLQVARSLLTAVKIPAEAQDRFLIEMIEGRFGIDWQRHVPGGGLIQGVA